MSERVDLLVRGGEVLTMDASGTVLREGAVAVRDGGIVAVGTDQDLGRAYEAAETLDASGCLVLPGLINTHTHLAMTLFRGRADDVDLQEFLARVIPAEAEQLDPGNVAAAVRLAVAESVRAGVTSALDMYWFHEAAEQAARDAGWRLHAGPTFMDVPEPPDRRAYAERLGWARRSLEARAPQAHGPGAGGPEALGHGAGGPEPHGHGAGGPEPHGPGAGGPGARAAAPGTRAVVFAHSAYTLAPEQLLEIFALGREFGALIHIHAAENAGEVAMVRERYGKRPVELLDSLGLLGPDVLLAHAVDLTPAEIAALARTGTSTAHCPVSNLKLGCGISPVPALLDAGVTVGLGTDGAVSSNSLDLLGAIRQAALVHKAGGDPTAVGAEQAVRMATIEGARALGLADQLGSLEPGKRADLIVLDTARPHLTPRHDPYAMLAYAAQSSDVRDTVVDGRVLMRERVLLTLDEGAVLAELTALAEAAAPGSPA